MLPRWNAQQRSAGTVDLAAAWGELGADGAGAIPIRVSRNAVVTVACIDAMRAQQIRATSEDLLDRLATATGVTLTRMDVVVADHAVTIPDFAGPVPREIPESARRAARQVVEGFAGEVTDPELRDAIARAAAGSIARTWDEKGAK
jgi:hypothetical protein